MLCVVITRGFNYEGAQGRAKQPDSERWLPLFPLLGRADPNVFLLLVGC